MQTPGDITFYGCEPARAKALCVFVHGRNQTPQDMVDAVLSHLDLAEVAFALPRAPAEAWYAARAIDPITATTTAELAESLSQVRQTASRLRDRAPGRPLLLAGFSQGACLSLEYAFAGEPAPDAICALTGCRVGQAKAGELPFGLPVYLSGSDADPWIPPQAMAEASLCLTLAGAALRTDVFPGRPHEVSGPERAMLASMLADLAAGRPIAFEASR